MISLVTIPDSTFNLIIVAMTIGFFIVGYLAFMMGVEYQMRQCELEDMEDDDD